MGGKKKFHTSRVCLVPLLVSVALPRRSLFSERLNLALIKLSQAGFMAKIMDGVRWRMYRSSADNMLHVSGVKSVLSLSKDRQLTLDDTSGTFLVLGAGFAIAVTALVLEVASWARRDIRERKEGQASIKKRIGDYCMANYRKLSWLVMSPGEEYMRDRERYVWQYICRQAGRRLSSVGWSLFGSKQATPRPSPRPSAPPVPPRGRPPPVSRYSF